ncbi:MAG: hypothetical protein FWB86_03490 [Treponema sp.]|nr:hypothetical protein [Treponema sp.]MCL2251221.1 hypothetical protein [Treponema sp.]
MPRKVIAFVTEFDKDNLSKLSNIDYVNNFKDFKSSLVGDVIPVISTDLYANNDFLTKELLSLISDSEYHFYTTIKENELNGISQPVMDNEIDIRELSNVETSTWSCEKIIYDLSLI